MFYVIGHDHLTDSHKLQEEIYRKVQSEQLERIENKAPYTKEREILHYAINRHDDPAFPDYRYFSYINSHTKDLLDQYNIPYEHLGEIDEVPSKASLLIRNSRFI